jgi:hypothetical protein
MDMMLTSSPTVTGAASSPARVANQFHHERIRGRAGGASAAAVLEASANCPSKVRQAGRLMPSATSRNPQLALSRESAAAIVLSQRHWTRLFLPSLRDVAPAASTMQLGSSAARRELLYSDRPVIENRGLGGLHLHLALLDVDKRNLRLPPSDMPDAWRRQATGPRRSASRKTRPEHVGNLTGALHASRMIGSQGPTNGSAGDSDWRRLASSSRICRYLAADGRARPACRRRRSRSRSDRRHHRDPHHPGQAALPTGSSTSRP